MTHPSEKLMNWMRHIGARNPQEACSSFVEGLLMAQEYPEWAQAYLALLEAEGAFANMGRDGIQKAMSALAKAVPLEAVS